MSEQEPVDGGQVIDRRQWLEVRVDGLIESQRHDEAIGYLCRLFEELDDPVGLARCATYLGYLYLLEGDLTRSEQWLERARERDADDPHLSYALGHVALLRGAPWRAVLRFMEAFVEAEEAHDAAEFLRSGACALRAGGQPAPAVSMLLGALDRDLGNPWILDGLARVYQENERWLESLQVLKELGRVVAQAASSMVVRRSPSARYLLRERLIRRSVRVGDVEARAREVNLQLRQRFEVVLDGRQRRGPTGLAPRQFPRALGHLLDVLGGEERGLELSESALGLWAQASHERFGDYLGAESLAAAVHVLVERLHWRVPSSAQRIAAAHGVDEERVGPAARVVAGKLGLQLFDTQAIFSELNLEERRRFEALSRALLFGEGLSAARTSGPSLGGK
ncbi:hypothetical protein DL240_10075 [Lujinxingia litoralis]|uniref:Tetratricopeptide repeat protein n=1 Tax=Lujinxingia litoralis TaxID=2211119 RepID=A0A328C980_9DELT|nr:hypothetical protein [Lujinxingia litoralis]RAL22193.1 hypothetical protein DL240_10075 [Lujinxingia litoralis]